MDITCCKAVKQYCSKKFQSTELSVYECMQRYITKAKFFSIPQSNTLPAFNESLQQYSTLPCHTVALSIKVSVGDQILDALALCVQNSKDNSYDYRVYSFTLNDRVCFTGICSNVVCSNFSYSDIVEDSKLSKHNINVHYSIVKAANAALVALRSDNVIVTANTSRSGLYGKPVKWYNVIITGCGFTFSKGNDYEY